MVAPKRIVRSPQWQDVNGLIPSTLELDGATLPTASKEKTGVVQVGDGLEVTPAGVISATELKNSVKEASLTARESSEMVSDLEERLTAEENRVQGIYLNLVSTQHGDENTIPKVTVLSTNKQPRGSNYDPAGYVQTSVMFYWPKWMVGFGNRLKKIEADILALTSRQPTDSPTPTSPATIQDSGWRDVSSLIPLNGKFRIRRWGEVVELVGESFTSTANVTGVAFPPGFNGQNFRGRPGDNHLTALISGNRLTIFNTLNNNSSAQGFRSTWLATDPFPTELPGTPDV